MEHSDVLRLCAAYIQDAATLFRVAMTSREQHANCIYHVQHHLPSLLVAAHEHATERYTQFERLDEVLIRAVDWLYRTAGTTAVGLPSTATAVVCSLDRLPYGLQQPLKDLAIKHGMHLSTETIVTAARGRVDVDTWLRRFFPSALDDYMLDELNQPFPVSTAIPTIFFAVLCHKMDVLEQLLPGVTPQTMQDLLYVAVNSGLEDPALALLQHDKQHTHVLHDVASCKDSSSAAALAEELLTTALMKGTQHMVSELAATPAAQSLSTAVVLKLLYLAIRHTSVQDSKYHPDRLHDGSYNVSPLCILPAAQALSADMVGSLMYYAMKQEQYGSVGMLSTLPQAQQLPSKQLVDLLLLVGKAIAQHRDNHYDDISGQDSLGRHGLLRELATLRSGRQLAPEDAMRLLKYGMAHPWGMEWAFSDVLDDLDPMDLGSQLTGKQMLKLLHAALATNDCITVTNLEPAVDRIDDEAAYVEFLETAMDSKVDPDVLNDAAMAIQLTQRLGVQTVMRLLRKSAGRTVPNFLLQTPALQQLPADITGQLLLQAARKGTLHQLQELLSIPATAQLSAGQFQELLQAVVAHGPQEYGDRELALLPKLLALPAARELTAGAVGQLLLQAASQLKPATASLDALEVSASEESDSCACEHEEEQLRPLDAVSQLLQLPAAQQLPTETVVQLLNSVITAGSQELISSICSLAAGQQISDADAQQLYEAGLQLGDPELLQTLQEELPQFAAAAARVQLTGDQLQKQLAHALQQRYFIIVCELCKHPATAQISPTGMQELLQRLISMLVEYDFDVEDMEGGLPPVLVNLEAAQALPPSAVANLLHYCINTRTAAGIKLTARLPAAGQLDGGCTEGLISRAVAETLKHPYAPSPIHVLNVLLKLPAVQAVPADAVQRLLQSVIQQDAHNSVFKVLCSQLPAAQQLTGQQVRDLLQLAIDEGNKLPVLKCLAGQLQGFRQLTADDVKLLMRAALGAQDSSMFAWLKALPAAAMDDEIAAWCVVLGLKPE